MATTVAFDLLSRLHEVATEALPDVLVIDGQGATNEPGNFLMIGVGDPDSSAPETSAEGSQDWAGLGANRANEEGTVTCCAISWSGDTGDAAQRAVRETVRDNLALLEAALVADPNLGGEVPGLMWVRFGRRVTLTQLSARDGVSIVVYFEIFYRARL